MATNAIDVGDAVRISVVFRNASTQVVIDPSLITLSVAREGNTTTTYTYGIDAALVRDAAGTYHLDFVPIVPGTHLFKWIGTGNMNAVEEGSFGVQTPRI